MRSATATATPDLQADRRAAEAWSYYTDQPVAYVEDMILPAWKDVRIQPYQAAILEALAAGSFVAFKMGNGMGKDTLCAWALEWFLVTRYLARCPTTSGSFRQVKSALWAEVHRWTTRSLAYRPYEDWPGIHMVNTRMGINGYQAEWFAEAFSIQSEGNPEDAERKAEGYHADHLLYIMTEAKAIDPAVFRAVHKACTGPDNKVLCQSVPGVAEGDFYRIFTTHRFTWNTHSFPSGRVRSRCRLCPAISLEAPDAGCPTHGRQLVERHLEATSPLVQQSALDRMWQYGEDSPLVQAGILVNFIKQGSDYAIPLSWVEAAQDRWAEMDPDTQGVEAEDGALVPYAIEAGVDVGEGEAETVCARRKGRYIFPLACFLEADPVQAAGMVGSALREPAPEVVRLDAGGPGWAFKPLLGEAFPIVGLDFGGVPRHPDRFADIATEMWATLRELLDPRNPMAIGLPPDPVLAAQLTSRKASYVVKASHTVWKLEPKKDMSKRNLPSPDRADALCLACASGSEAAGGWVEKEVTARSSWRIAREAEAERRSVADSYHRRPLITGRRRG